MDYFNLPSNTIIQKSVPKNSFDAYTNSKQKEAFIKDIAKMIWSNKLSAETINLNGKDITEIQIFVIELKEKKDIAPLLHIIDKAIPYHIVFIIRFDTFVYLSTSSKHPSPLNDNKSVIDWTFKSEWHHNNERRYTLELKQDLDYVFYNLCQQLSLKSDSEHKTINDLIQYNSQIATLTKEIEQIKRSIAACKQFNKKVELNLRLKQIEVILSTWRGQNTY